MKKFLVLLVTGCMICSHTASSQGFIKKVAKSVTEEIKGALPAGSEGPKDQPEPPSACSDAVLILDMSGNLKLDYKEISLSMKDDGSVLVKDRITSKYYVITDGKTKGPFAEGSPEVLGFEKMDESDRSPETLLLRYREFIKKSGDKYIINFSGKSYGPYAQITDFAVTASKSSFAAMTVENIPVSEDEGEKMEEAMKNAKTDQERMELAMKYSQLMQQRVMQGGGPGSMLPKLVTNVPGASFDPMSNAGGQLNGRVKYNDIVVVAYNKILDLKGNTLTALNQEATGSDQLYLSSTGSKYAWYRYGTLFFSDGTSLAELFNPYLLNADGANWLAYMYYSPKKNAIMQCRVPF